MWMGFRDVLCSTDAASYQDWLDDLNDKYFENKKFKGTAPNLW